MIFLVVLHDARFGGVRSGQTRGPELFENADPACVGVFPGDVDSPLAYALAGCGRRCATLLHRETARFRSTQRLQV